MLTWLWIRVAANKPTPWYEMFPISKTGTCNYLYQNSRISTPVCIPAEQVSSAQSICLVLETLHHVERNDAKLNRCWDINSRKCYSGAQPKCLKGQILWGLSWPLAKYRFLLWKSNWQTWKKKPNNLELPTHKWGPVATCLKQTISVSHLRYFFFLILTAFIWILL